MAVERFGMGRAKAIARIGVMAAMLLPAILPLSVLAQEGPVLLDDAVAVVDDAGVGDGQSQGWVDPGTGEVWTDPSAAPADGGWVDPNAVAADPGAAPADETWVDPNAVAADPAAVPEEVVYDENGNPILQPEEVQYDENGNPIALPDEVVYEETGEPIAEPVDAVAADPNAAPLDPMIANNPAALAAYNAGYATEAQQVAAEAAPGQPFVPVEQLPVIAPMTPPMSTGELAPDPNWAPPSKVYIPETEQPLGGGFLDVWRKWGGQLSWGYPLTPELQENGVTVQYFSYGRFEYHPDDPNGNTIQFSKLGEASRPFMIRRAPVKGETTAKESVAEAMAWLPIDPADVPADARFVPETGHSLTGEMLAFWTQTGEAGYLGNPVSEAFQRDGKTYQVFERGRVVQEPGAWPSLVPIGKTMALRWGVPLAPSAQGNLPAYDEALWTPPPASTKLNSNSVQPPANGERYVLVSLSQQYAWAYQGDVIMWQGYVSTGRPGYGTPAGTFQVLTKYKSQTMEGVLGGEYYNVPDVPNVMYFTNQGHALHGAYWHNNFGTPMSHGCVNLPLDVAAWMYDWAPMGMRVTIVP